MAKMITLKQLYDLDVALINSFSGCLLKLEYFEDDRAVRLCSDDIYIETLDEDTECTHYPDGTGASHIMIEGSRYRVYQLTKFLIPESD